jgi:hypothetical protein
LAGIIILMLAAANEGNDRLEPAAKAKTDLMK